MRIIVQGEPNQVDVNLLKAAIIFFNKTLIKNENISIKLRFVPGLKNKKKRFAWCEPLINTWFTFATPRSFLIEMDANLSQRMAGITLAHEYVHIEQMFFGLLKSPPYYTKLTWLGHFLNPDEAEETQPHEIEARGRELYLYEMFINQY